MNSKHNQVKTVQKQQQQKAHISKFTFYSFKAKTKKLWGKFSESYSVQDQNIDQITGI